MAQRGYMVRVYTRRPYGDPTRNYMNGVERYPLWAPRLKGLEAIVHTFLGILHLAVGRRQFDILHIHAIGPSLFTPLAKLLGIRVVVTNHGPDYERQKWGRTARLILRLGERWGTKHADAVIAVAQYIQQRLEERFGRRIHYIPNGIPELRRVSPGSLLRRLGIEPRRYVLSVGRLVPEKGFHDLLDAFRGLDTQWKLVITGDADHRDEYYSRVVQQAKLDPRVVLTGMLTGTDLEEVYSSAAIFVLPSYHEGLPLTLLEALSFRLPVLVTDIPANREVMTDACRSFQPGDVKRLNELLTCEINALSACNGLAAVDDVNLSAFNWERITDRTLEVYALILS